MSSDRFMFFKNFKQIAIGLPDDMRLKFYDALGDYAFDDIEPEDPIIKSLITAIKPSLDKVEKRGGTRTGAGAPKNNQNAKKTIIQTENNQKQSKTIKDNQNNQSFLETETETETETKEKIIKKKKVFIPPTLEEVKEYCKTRGIVESVAVKIFDYYTALDWRDSQGKKIEKWKAKIIAVWDKPENHIEQSKPYNPDDPDNFKL